MMKKSNIGTRVFLSVVLAAALLGAMPGYADTRDADLVKQGADALKHHQYDTAIARFSDAIRLVPEDAEAWSERGEAYADKGDSDRALADCAQAVKLAPSSSEVYRRCGNVYFIAEDFQRAIPNYDTAIKRDPGNAYAFADRGSAYGHLNQTDRAIADYDRALTLDPSLSSTYASRGNAWLRKGDFDRAWDDFNRAVEADPKNAYAYVSRGYAAASRYAYDDAIADYDQAIRVDPTYKDAYRYRDLALERKSDSRWGYIYLVLFGVGMLALLFAAFWTYSSPTAFSHGVERHFKRIPDGRLVFYPRMKGAGYVVPDTEKEQALRLFARRSWAAALAYGVLGPVLMSVLVLPSMAALTWLQPRIGISTAGAIFIASVGCVSVVLAGGLMAFSRWRRAAVRGLVEAAEQGEPPPSDQWNNDFVLDIPVAVRWIVFAVILFVSFQSLKGLWRMRHDLSVARLESMSWFGWVCIAGYLFTLWYCGKLLIYAARQRGRRTGRAQKPA
jgi:tetratricopeptide (TPR) repeat protein